MELIDNIKAIVKDPMLQLKWYSYKPEVYFKDGLPYGLITTLFNGEYVIIVACTSDEKYTFTRGMLRDIYRISKAYNRVMTVSDAPIHFKAIKKNLKRVGFDSFEVVDGNLIAKKG